MKINKSLESLLLPIDKLVPLDGNPRRGNVDAIVASYSEFGQVKPIVVRPNKDGTFTVLAGNHQVRAAKELESSESPQAAAAAMRRLVEINVRRTQNASDDVLRRRKNANFPDPERPIEVPKFDVQIIDNAEYQRFLKNPKFPSGTTFIDPEGQRRTKP